MLNPARSTARPRSSPIESMLLSPQSSLFPFSKAPEGELKRAFLGAIQKTGISVPPFLLPAALLELTLRPTERTGDLRYLVRAEQQRNNRNANQNLPRSWSHNILLQQGRMQIHRKRFTLLLLIPKTRSAQRSAACAFCARLHVLHRNACRLVQLLPERLCVPRSEDERQLLLILERLADRRDQLQVKRRGDDQQGCEEDEADKTAVPVGTISFGWEKRESRNLGSGSSAWMPVALTSGT